MFKHKNSGVTLIELIVVLAILSLVMIMATSFFKYSFDAYKKDDAQWQIQQDARHAIRQLENDVRPAQTMSIDTTVSPPVLIINSSIRYYKKNLPDDKLYRNVNGTENVVIQNLNSISFSLDSASGVLSLVLITKKTGSDNTFKISTKLFSRLN